MPEIQKIGPEQADKNRNQGIGFGLFLLLAGLALLAQRAGFIPSQFDWFFPAILIAWGASEIYRRTTSG